MQRVLLERYTCRTGQFQAVANFRCISPNTPLFSLRRKKIRVFPSRIDRRVSLSSFGFSPAHLQEQFLASPRAPLSTSGDRLAPRKCFTNLEKESSRVSKERQGKHRSNRHN